MRRLAVVLVLGVGLAVASPASARIVSCGEVLTADTRLDNDLTCGTVEETPLPEPALRIGAPGITVDLNGHEVRVVPDDGTAIENLGHDDVTIRNGRISGPDSLVIDVRLANVKGNVLRDLSIRGYGNVLATNTVGLRLSHLEMRGFASFVSGDDADLADLDTTNEIDVVGDGNRVRSLTGAFLFVRGADNSVSHVRHTPIIVGGSGNWVANNVAPEIRVMPGSTANALVGNTASGSSESGITVPADAAGTTLRGNVAFGNADDGIHVDAPGTVLANNRAYENGDLGIEAVPGVIDAGGNRAWGNGNPLQCLNVVCR